MPIIQRHIFEACGLFLISLIVFTWGLSHQEILGFESRFYLFALEMWQNGLSWFPTTYQRPYPDYPATSTFLIYLSACLFGHISKFIAVLPSAMAAAITVTMTYLIGALHDKRWGIYAVFLMFFTVTFLKTARSVELDMYSVMITTSCFYLVYVAGLRKEATSRWCYVLLFLGFAFRGPIGLVVPAGVICTYYLLDLNFKKLLLTGACAFFILLSSMLLMLVLAHHVGGYPFMQDVLRMQAVGRINNYFLPVYFYFTNSLASYALSYPLAMLVAIEATYYLVIGKKLTIEIKFLIKLFGWMLIILVGMSLPGDKKIRYILPMVPAAALMAAYIFVAPQQQTYFYFLKRGLLSIFLHVPAVFLLAFFCIFNIKNIPTINTYYLPLVLFLSLMQLSVWSVFYYYRKRKSLRELLILLMATFTFIIMEIEVVERIELSLEGSRDFVRQIEVERWHRKAALVFYKEKPDGLPIKYLINMPRPDRPIFIEGPLDLQRFNRPAIFISSEVYFSQLPKIELKDFQVISEGQLGHEPVVVFVSIRAPK